VQKYIIYITEGIQMLLEATHGFRLIIPSIGLWRGLDKIFYGKALLKLIK
jgi:hypothetical protein